MKEPIRDRFRCRLSVATGATAIAVAGLKISVAHGAAPAAEYGLNPANTNVSEYVGPVSSPVVRWQISHSIGQIDNPSMILDSRGVLFAQSLSPVAAVNGRAVGINIPSARDSTPVIDAGGNIYEWVNGRMRAYTAAGTPLWTGPTTNLSDGYSVKIGPDGTL